ncbi:MAG: sterol desaturase family protein, partial [Alphaproteobacteria bacterium]|nr:sterol desaturase family protein [Alphaproteobacteria bacterium]
MSDLTYPDVVNFTVPLFVVAILIELVWIKWKG